MPTNKTSHIEKIAEALKKNHPDSSLLTTMRKRFQQVKSGQLDPTPPEKGKTPTHAWQRPHAQYVFDPKKESWQEFSKRVGLSN